MVGAHAVGSPRPRKSTSAACESGPPWEMLGLAEQPLLSPNAHGPPGWAAKYLRAAFHAHTAATSAPLGPSQQACPFLRALFCRIPEAGPPGNPPSLRPPVRPVRLGQAAPESGLLRRVPGEPLLAFREDLQSVRLSRVAAPDSLQPMEVGRASREPPGPTQA